MGRKNAIELRFPAGGLFKYSGFQRLPPFSTPDCMNVRPIDTLEGRDRGGSRPGLGKAFYQQLGSGNPVRMLAGVTVVQTDSLQFWTDNFKGSSLGAAWSAASWLAGGLPSILPSNLSGLSYGSSPVGAIRTALTFDSTLPYQVDLFVVPWQGAHHGKYSIFLKANDTTPAATTDGVVVELSITGATGVYSGTAKIYAAGVLINTYTLTGATTGTAEAGWFSALWTPSTSNLKVYWLGTNILNQNTAGLGVGAGNRFGFGMECTVADGITLIDTFRIQYQTAVNAQVRRRLLAASANGLLYKDGDITGMVQVSSSLTLASDRNLQAAENAQKLYIADNGNPRYIGGADTISGASVDHAAVANWTVYGISVNDDVIVVSNGTGSVVNGTYGISVVASGSITAATSIGIGTATIRIERAPKVYDPVAATLVIMAATAGQVPTGCPLIANYRGRIVVAGAPAFPHVWYMSRQGSPLDWDYAAVSTDGGRAVAGTSTDTGTVGEPLLALIAHTDDYMIFGCENSMWILRGDPAYGGKLSNLSRTEGIVGQAAWCRGPAGETIFLSRNGLQMIPPDGGGCIPLSQDKIPRELIDTDVSNYTPLLEYDPRDRGVHIYMTPNESRSQNHFWFDYAKKTFWPVGLNASHEPTSIHRYNAPAAEDAAVLLGCRDGYIRRYRASHERDDGTAFSSYVFYGPIRLGGDDYHDGIIDEVIGVTAKNGGDVGVTVYTGPSHESAFDDTRPGTATWDIAGLNFKFRPRKRGASFYLKLANGQTGRAWAIERVTAKVNVGGKQRLL
ncbi:MAG: hypothetical protein WC100_03360 [Sterolibacterium sp.]